MDKRLAVVEEGRRTVAAEVKAAMTETMAAWEVERARREAQEERDALEQHTRQLPSP